MAFLREVLPIADLECRERFETGLRKAGMPE